MPLLMVLCGLVVMVSARLLLVRAEKMCTCIVYIYIYTHTHIDTQIM